jgi:hypothetical protein
MLVLTALFVFVSEQAHAYLDPGSASLIFQGLIASIIGGLVVIRVYWGKLTAFFSGRSDQTDKLSELDDQIGQFSESDEKS